MIEGLQAAVAQVKADERVKVVVIEANSKDTGVFCSGHNLKEMAAQREELGETEYRKALEELFSVGR